MAIAPTLRSVNHFCSDNFICRRARSLDGFAVAALTLAARISNEICTDQALNSPHRWSYNPSAMQLRLTNRHIIAFNFLLVVGIAYFSASSVNQIVLQRLQGPPYVPPASPLSNTTAENHPRAYYDEIVNRDIFNLEAPPRPAPVIKTIDLHMKLLGTSSSSKDKPFAIIEDQGGEQSLYTLGDDIPGAGKLTLIEKSRVIIQHDGQPTALEIPQDQLPGGVRAPSLSRTGHPAKPAPRSLGPSKGLLKDKGPTTNGAKAAQLWEDKAAELWKKKHR